MTSDSDPSGLREKLLAVTRQEFRGDEIVFAVDDPVFGSPPCSVPGCRRGSHSRGLCNGHHARWNYAGRPDLAQFTATATLLGHRDPVPECGAADCRFAASHGGCATRTTTPGSGSAGPNCPPGSPCSGRWSLGDRPSECAVDSCGRWAQTTGPLCRPHAEQWRRQGRPPVEEFARPPGDLHELPPCERIILTGLAPHLRREMQYALQPRRDDAAGKATPDVVGAAIRMLTASGAISVLDRPEEGWRKLAPSGKSSMAIKAVRLIVYARRRLEDLLDGTGWEVEYPRDIWRLRSLGLSTTNATLRFDRIPHPWLRDLAKRWSRWRLSTGTSKSTSSLGVRTLTHFARFSPSTSPPSTGSRPSTELFWSATSRTCTPRWTVATTRPATSAR